MTLTIFYIIATITCISCATINIAMYNDIIHNDPNRTWETKQCLRRAQRNTKREFKSWQNSR